VPLDDSASQEDFDYRFFTLITLYGPWEMKTTPIVNRRLGKKYPGEGDGQGKAKR